MRVTKKYALGRMAVLCSRKEYCRSQIEEKLRKLLDNNGESVSGSPHSKDEMNSCEMVVNGFDDGKEALLQIGDIPEIIGVLVKEKYLSDERFASAYVNDKLQFGGWGRNKIVYGLRGLRVDCDAIHNAIIERYVEKSAAVIERLVAAKLKSVRGKPDVKNRVVRYMISKGFSYNEFSRFLGD